MIKTILFGYNMVLIWPSKEGDKMLRKIKFILFSVLILLLCTSCAQTEHEPTHPNKVSFGNIQHGGYFVECKNGYIFDGDGNLCKKDMQTNAVEIIAKGPFFYNLNLYNDYIYYIHGSPGAIWKISVDGKRRKMLTWKSAEHLIVYDDHIYFRHGKDYTRGKLYRTDLNGRKAKLLAQCVEDFCIVDDRIYYSNIETEPKLCSMKTDGTDATIINQAYPLRLLPLGNKLIYADRNREDKMFIYDLNTDTETCICEDRCWELNASEEWIFFRNQSEMGDLYRIRPDGSEKEKLADGNIINIHVIGNSVFYKEFSNMHEFKRIDIE